MYEKKLKPAKTEDRELNAGSRAEDLYYAGSTIYRNSTFTFTHIKMAETETSLPSAPLVDLGQNVVIQPPLSRCGRGPGLIIVRPIEYSQCHQKNDSLDPEPIKKLAEESYAVVQITVDHGSSDPDSLLAQLNRGIDGLASQAECSLKDKFGLLSTQVDDSYICITLIDISIWVPSKLCATHGRDLPHCFSCGKEYRSDGVLQPMGYSDDKPSARSFSWGRQV